MKRPDKAVSRSSLAVLLASEGRGGRLQLEWASPALAALTSAEDLASYVQAVFEALQGAHPDDPSTPLIVQRVDALGTEHLDRVSGRRFTAGGTRYWIACVEDSLAVTVSDDEREQLADRITAGATAVQRFLRITDVMRAEVTAQSAVAAVPPLLVPALATWVFIAVTAPGGDAWSATAAAHEDGSFPAEFHRYVATLLPAQLRQSQQHAVLTGRQPFALISAVDFTTLALTIPLDAAKALASMSTGSMLTVPLRADSAVTGLLLLARDTERRPFSVQDVETALLLGRRVGTTLRGVEQVEAQRSRAITAQNALLPELPAIPGVEAVSIYRPSASYASVGGDWFGMIPLDDGALGLSIGDVCGHDIGSASAMAAYRWTIHTYLWQGRNPGEALELLDRQLDRNPDFPQLATAVVARVERSDRHCFRLSYATAGHLPAVVLSPGGGQTQLNNATSTPIGIVPASGSRPVRTMEFPYGSTVVMFTDGLVERRDASLRDRLDALHVVLGSVDASAPVEEIRNALLRLSDGPYLEDDMCLLVARIDPLPARAVTDLRTRRKVLR